MSEDLVLLEEQARRFIADQFVPHLDRWHEAHIYDRDVWTKAGEAGLLCASMPEEYGGAGGTFAHEAVINREFTLAGFDTFGAPLHSGIVAPYILHYGTEDQKKRILPAIPVGYMGESHDIAASVAFLASEEARYITGQTLHVNGGMAMI